MQPVFLDIKNNLLLLSQTIHSSNKTFSNQRLPMLSIFFFILSGVAVGYLSRNRTQLKHVGSVINIIIIVLLFFLGVAVGANKQIIESFASIGFDAFAIASAATLGSVLCAWFVFHRFFKNNTKNNKGPS